MNILYVSSVCSEKIMNFVFEGLSDKSGIAIQKFHRLLLTGFAGNKINTIQTLSTIPVSPYNHKKRFWNLKSEEYNGIQFNYVPIINFALLKNTMVFVYSFFKFLFWKFPNKSKGSLIICDALSLSISSAALAAFKIRGNKVIGIVTDIPGLSVRKQNLLKRWMAKLRIKVLQNYSGYILITEQMNSIVNPNKKPFLIMEGSVDANLVDVENLLENKSINRIILYAGGLYEKYGIKKLIKAFMKLDKSDLRLHLYGTGPMEKEIEYYIEKDKRIFYWGVVPNEIIVEQQIISTLLVNPRSSVEEFTKYSFPIKNHEYMTSGTPTVTTPLPGMPKDYIPFVYLFEDESIDGIYNTLKILLDKPSEELHAFGKESKTFMLQNKNNYIQAERITNFYSLNLS